MEVVVALTLKIERLTDAVILLCRKHKQRPVKRQ